MEITESVLMGEAESGTGYSSLSYLHRFPIDVLKIDQSFVQGIGCPKGNGIIVNAVIAMGISFKQRVIAEGVEEEGQLAFLKAQHCEEGQGYLFSRPLVAETFAKLLVTGITRKDRE